MNETQDEREFTIYACIEPGCDYYRDRLDTGVHMVSDPDDNYGSLKRHKIAPLKVVAAPTEDES